VVAQDIFDFARHFPRPLFPARSEALKVTS
jgi:hypothetical protein